MEAKFIFCGGDSAYVADLEEAISDFTDPLNSKQIITLAQLHAALNVVYQRVSYYKDSDLVTLVLLGREAEALSHARLRISKYEKFKGLLAIYKGLQLAGLSSQQLLDEILETTKSLKRSRLKTEELHEIAISLAKINQLDESLSVAQLIDDSEKFAHRSVTIAEVWAASGQFEKAAEILTEVLTLFQPIEARESFIYILSKLSEMLAISGQNKKSSETLTEAFVQVQAIEGKESKAYLLSVLSRVLLANDQSHVAFETLSEALEIAHSIEATKIRVEVLSVIAKSLSEIAKVQILGDSFEKFLEVAQFIDAGLGTQEALFQVLKAMLQIGRFDKALEVIDLIEYGEYKVKALSEMAQNLAENGELADASDLLHQALSMMQLIELNERQELTLIEISKALVLTIPHDLVLKVVEFMSQEGVVKILNEIAKVLAENNQLDVAIKILDQALDLISEIEDSESQVRLLTNTAKSLVSIGQIEKSFTSLNKALIAVPLIEKYQTQSCKFIEIARVWSTTSSFDDVAETLDRALELVPMIEGDIGRGYVQSEIISVLAVGNRIKKALEIARSIEDSSSKAIALSAVFKVLEKFNRIDEASKVLDEALITARLVEDRLKQVSTLYKIAEVMLDIGRVEQALELLPLIQARDRQAKILGKVAASRILTLREAAKALAKVGQRKEAIKKLDEGLKLARSIEDRDSRTHVLREIASDLAEHHYFGRAFTILERRQINKFLSTLSKWQNALNQVELGLSQKVLIEVLRIVGWLCPQWQQVYEILCNLPSVSNSEG